MNALDGKLTLLHDGALDVNEFMDYLLTAQVFVPIEDASSKVGGSQSNEEAKLLSLEAENEEGEMQQVIPVFSDPEASKDFLSNFAEYSSGLLVEISWILDKVTKNTGVSINPNMELGLDLDTETIQQLVTLKHKMEQV